jgi:aspartate/methionine/tyrosine aminotransferase
MLPKLSNSDTTLSSIRETFKKVKEDSSIINLCIGEPAGMPPKQVVDAYTQTIEQYGIHYANDAGMPALREMIALHEGQLKKSYFHPYDNLVISNGGTNGIYSVSRAILDPGDEVLLLDPVWIAFIQITRLLQCTPIMVPTYAENNFVPSLDDLKKLVSPKTKMLVVVSPANPSGTVFSKADMQMLLNFSEQQGIWLLHDEAYRDIIFDGFEHHSDTGHHLNAISVGTLSKSHNMTGARVGWVLSSNKDLIERVRKNIAYNVMCVNTPSQYAAMAAIGQCQDWLEKNVVQYHESIQKAYTRLIEMGFSLNLPKGSFYLFPKHTYGRPIAEEILENHKVAIIDGDHFGACGKNHVRISCSVSPEILEEGLNRLENWVKEQNIS